MNSGRFFSDATKRRIVYGIFALAALGGIASIVARHTIGLTPGVALVIQAPGLLCALAMLVYLGIESRYRRRSGR